MIFRLCSTTLLASLTILTTTALYARPLAFTCPDLSNHETLGGIPAVLKEGSNGSSTSYFYNHYVDSVLGKHYIWQANVLKKTPYTVLPKAQYTVNDTGNACIYIQKDTQQPDFILTLVAPTAPGGAYPPANGCSSIPAQDAMPYIAPFGCLQPSKK